MKKYPNSDIEELYNCLGEKYDNVNIEGQLIQPPHIFFGENIIKKAEKGDIKVVHTTPYNEKNTLDNVYIYVYDLIEDEYNFMCNILRRAAAGLGIQIKNYEFLNLGFNKEENSFMDKLKESSKKFQDNLPEFIFFFMNKKYKNDKYYNIFKYFINKLDLAIPSQVILYDENNFDQERILSQYTNILIQMWAKMGLELYTCDFSFVPKTMVIAYSSLDITKTCKLTSLAISYGTKLYEYAFYSAKSNGKDNNTTSKLYTLLYKALKLFGKIIKINIQNIVI